MCTTDGHVDAVGDSTVAFTIVGDKMCRSRPARGRLRPRDARGMDFALG
jgi:hypothetical protein